MGKATLLALVAHDPARIYFTGRNSQAGAAVLTEAKALAPNCSVTFIQCDLSSTRDTIRRDILGKFDSDRLDICIANAGVMAVPPGLTREGFEIQFGTNYLGHTVVLHLLLPTMLRTVDIPDGGDVRLVVLSSFGHTLHPPGGINFDKLRIPDAGSKWQRYGQSKLADILLTKFMAKKYPDITSVSVHPGLVRTELGRRVERSIWTPVLTLARLLPLYKDPEEGAHNTLWAATTLKSNLRNGAYYEPVGKLGGKQKRASGMADICNDDDLAEQLREWTERELKDLEKL